MGLLSGAMCQDMSRDKGLIVRMLNLQGDSQELITVITPVGPHPLTPIPAPGSSTMVDTIPTLSTQGKISQRKSSPGPKLNLQSRLWPTILALTKETMMMQLTSFEQGNNIDIFLTKFLTVTL